MSERDIYLNYAHESNIVIDECDNTGHSIEYNPMANKYILIYFCSTNKEWLGEIVDRFYLFDKD